MIKDTLHYLQLAAQYGNIHPENFPSKISVNLITNFTDDVLKKIFTGVLLDENIYPIMHAAPYKQYHLYLKSFTEHLRISAPDIAFVFFDVNPYLHSEFTVDGDHFADTLRGLREYCAASPGTVVVSTCLLPYRGVFGNLHGENPLFRLVQDYNDAFGRLAQECKNVHMFDTNAVVHELGEIRARDFRGLYAFDTPFSNDFTVRLCREWLMYIRLLLGRVRKCVVVDMDNTLWGGVVGEVGTLGITLGPTYPGNAYQNFQRALAALRERGIMLAVNSRNNPADIQEVFEKNPHMVLRENDFAAIRANWQQKDENIRSIAEELNIGLDSMVFIDDDPFNRDLVRQSLPDVLVPEFSMAPEAYVPELYSWNVFNQLAITDEDKQKSRMYTEERKRREVLQSAGNIEEYIAGLQIVIEGRRNDAAQVPRIVQLAQKTNQFNLTTKRYTEGDIARFMREGWGVYAGAVTDRFGQYGTVLVAIVSPFFSQEVALDSFLMSCRTMGRGIEYRFLDAVIRDAALRGATKIRATYIPTRKNEPVKTFLPEMAFAEARAAEDGTREFVLDIPDYLQNPPACVRSTLAINLQ